MNNNKLTGLIGYPLSHSFSRNYFNEKFEKEGLSNFQYRNFEINSVDKFMDIVNSHPELIGLNVTIPYKESIIPFLHEISKEATAISAVNTICINRSPGKTLLSGHNTDHIGFEKTLDIILNNKPVGAMILGTGGASKAVRYVLEKRNIRHLFVSRKPELNSIGYKDINNTTIREYPLVINTTPLGMFPNVDQAPDIPYDLIGTDNILIDLIYNPKESLFLKKGREFGAAVMNGLPMLISQAEAAWKLWNKQ